MQQGAVLSDQQILNSLFITNGKLADVVEYNGRCGVTPPPPSQDAFLKALDDALREIERDAARKSAEDSKKIEQLRRELNEKNLIVGDLMSERDDFQQKSNRCQAMTEQLAQDAKTWSQKCDAELAKTMGLQEALAQEKRMSTKRSQDLEEIRRRLSAASQFKEEGEGAIRAETDQFKRLITKLKGIISTHGTGDGKPCDPALFEIKLQRVLDAVRSDCNRKYEEFQRKWDQLMKLEANPKIREMENERNTLESELLKLKRTFSSLESEISQLRNTNSGLQQKISKLEATNSHLEKLRLEIHELRRLLEQAEIKNNAVIAKCQDKLPFRARVQNGLNEYENLLKVEEERNNISSPSSPFPGMRGIAGKFNGDVEFTFRPS